MNASVVSFGNYVVVTDGEAARKEHSWPVFFLVPLVLFGMVGNILVCLAITIEKRLQSVTNYFLLSLGITDLLVCIVVWPFSIVSEFTGHWPLNVVLCDLYVTLDVLLCTSSILHLCTISLERFLAIQSPLASRTRSKTATRIKIVLVWATSLAIGSPIMILGLVNQGNILRKSRCILNNKYFIIYGSVSAFYIPLSIMGIFFGLTIRQLRAQGKLCDPAKRGREGFQIRRFKHIKTGSFRRRFKELQKEQAHKNTVRKYSLKSSKGNEDQEDSVVCIENMKPQSVPDTEEPATRKPLINLSSYSDSFSITFSKSFAHSIENKSPSDQFHQQSNAEHEENEIISNVRCHSMETSVASLAVAPTDVSVSDFNDNDSEARIITTAFSAPSCLSSLVQKRRRSPVQLSSISHGKKNSDKQKQMKQSVHTEHKASKTLWILFVAFVLCWAPFFIVNILTGLCETCKVDDLLVTIFVWLGYVSSTLNPIIYTVFNETFRSTIWKLLKCQCRNVQKRMRVKALCISLHYGIQNQPESNAKIPV